jgi:hypothetical protein
MKKIYFFMLMMFAAIAANAVTLSGVVWLWDGTTQTSEKSDEPIEEEATISDGVITFADFLGSGETLNVTVNTDGTAVHDHAAGDDTGLFSIGTFGDYEMMYFYAGTDSYTNFRYYVQDGVKTLHFRAYVGHENPQKEDWTDIYFTLPDDFAPYNPYEGQSTATVTVKVLKTDDEWVTSSIDYTENLTAYYKNGALTVLGLFGTSSITYVIDEDGDITSNLSGWVLSDYTYKDVQNTYVWGYGYQTYDPTTRTISDSVGFYESNTWTYFTIQLPDDFTPKPLNFDLEVEVGLYDYDTKKDVWSKTLGSTPAKVKNGVVSFSNFLGSGKEIVVTAYSDGTATHDQATGIWEGPFDFADYGSQTGMYLYAGDGYDDFAYEDEGEDGKYLYLGVYAPTGEGDWYELYFALPDDFVPQTPVNPYEGMEKREVKYELKKYAATDALATGTVDAYFDEDGNVYLDNFLGIKGIQYTISADNSITSNWSENWYTGSYTYEDTEYTSFYAYGTTYLSYDASRDMIKDYIYIKGLGSGQFDFYIYLSDKDPYEGLTKISATVTVYTDVNKAPGEVITTQKAVTAYTGTGKVVLNGLLNINSDITYTIADDNTITSSVNEDYAQSTGFDINGTAAYWICFYTTEKGYYDAENNVIYDRVYIYETSSYNWIGISLTPSSAVNDIIADDANAPVEYFNLQGVRVNNPENGLFIRRQGGKASKVIIR